MARCAEREANTLIEVQRALRRTLQIGIEGGFDWVSLGT
jgi:hypothetical protein